MQIQIFDVAHGFCAYVIADNNNTMLVDCGHNDETEFQPGDYLLANGCTGIGNFFVLNYDKDHLSGLPRLRALKHRIPIQVLYRNPTITPDQLRALKLQSGPLSPGITALLEMLRIYLPGMPVPPLYANLEHTVYYNYYPIFTDTNNLSLVLFLQYPKFSIVFPGDLEKAGWRALLQNASFRKQLIRVNIFVASHHGRDSGYVKEVFDYCSPDIVVISDEPKQYETQETNYSIHASGVPWDTGETRRVLSTRKDGMITVTYSTSQQLRYRITTSK